MRVDRWQWHLLAVRLADAAGTEHADLVSLRRVDTTLQAEILRTGRMIYSLDDDVRLEFETLVVSMYQRLNDERAGNPRCDRRARTDAAAVNNVVIRRV